MEKQDLNVSLEYLSGMITWLETFTNKRLTDQEVKFWTERLQKYPKWKLNQITEYTGGLNNNVFKFLDELRSEPESAREVLGSYAYPDAKQIEHKPDKEIGKLSIAYFKKLYELSGKEADAYEREFIFSMRKKFPNLDWIAGRTENRGL